MTTKSPAGHLVLGGKSRRAERSDADAGKKPASHQGFHNTVGATLNHKVRSSPLLDLPVFIERVRAPDRSWAPDKTVNASVAFIDTTCWRA
jgi:hypothetical protein